MAATVQTSWGRGLVFWNSFLNPISRWIGNRWGNLVWVWKSFSVKMGPLCSTSWEHCQNSKITALKSRSQRIYVFHHLPYICKSAL